MKFIEKLLNKCQIKDIIKSRLTYLVPAVITLYHIVSFEIMVGTHHDEFIKGATSVLTYFTMIVLYMVISCLVNLSTNLLLQGLNKFTGRLMKRKYKR